MTTIPEVSRWSSRSSCGDLIPLLSFFTGAGLLDIGFARSGFESVWHNEIEPWFVRGFEAGMTSLGMERSSIQNTSSIVELRPELILDEAFGGSRPDVFGMIGGPPCPDFSVAGKQAGGTGDRGSLSLTYVQSVLDLRPTFFVFENVPGLMRTAKHRAFLCDLRLMLEPSYSLDVRILNALDYGVPQDRERVFMIGFRRDSVHRNMSDFPWPHDDRYVDAKARFRWPTTDPFGGDPPRPDGVPEELMVGPLICGPEVAELPNGREGFNPYSGKFLTIDEGDDSKKSFKRLHRWRYSPAAAYGNNEVHLHPTEPRRITVREAMRIQTIPDEYVLPADMPLSHKFKTIGNGVPVRLAEAVARAVAEFLEVQ